MNHDPLVDVSEINSVQDCLYEVSSLEALLCLNES